jgi:UDP-N-acetylmuramoylalanine--D-glutamate ligase
MKALVVGMGVSGLSIARYLAAEGATVLAVDSRREPPCLAATAAISGVKAQSNTNIATWQKSDFDSYDLVAKSPGIPLSHITAPVEKITGDAALFADAWRRNPPNTTLLAVTGTNGKSTVTELSAQLCTAAGRRAEAIGNIGEPLLDAWQRWQQTAAPDVAVAELSSFQLETASNFTSDIAAVLNISPDHLDHHSDMATYTTAKAQLYHHAARRVVNADDTAVTAMTTSPDVTFSATERTTAAWHLTADAIVGDARFALTEMAAPPHSALAALALTDGLSLDTTARRQALANFSRLPHRQQIVSHIDNVTYINDSKATNVASACFALKQLLGNAVIIAGGDGKGQDFTRLATEAQGRVRLAVLLGRDALQLQTAFTNVGIATQQAKNMPEAVFIATQAATAGDTVMLSPACSSLDMYTNYGARGDAFISSCLNMEHRCATQ